MDERPKINVRIGSYGNYTSEEQDNLMIQETLAAMGRALHRRQSLDIADDTEWPSCAVHLSVQECGDLLRSMVAWPPSLTPLRDELRAIVAFGSI